MNETTRHSEKLGTLAKALASAQAEIEDAKKDRQNPHFKNWYATLSSVRAAVTPALSKHNIAVTQLNEPHGPDGVCVVTMLIHESGEWLSSSLYVPVSKKDPQGFGSALSYARRYALAAIVGIASDEDDDGEQASKLSAPKAQAPAAQAAVDVDALVKALETAKDAKALSEASLAVGRAKDKLTDEDRKRCRAAHDNRLRELEKGEAA